MDPTGPSQPSLDTAYNTAGNPVEQTDNEKQNASVKASSNSGSQVEARERGDVPVPSSHDEGPASTSLGYGTRSSAEDRKNVSKIDSDGLPLYFLGKRIYSVCCMSWVLKIKAMCIFTLDLLVPMLTEIYLLTSYIDSNW